MNPTFVPDEVVTAAKMNQLPKGVVAYVSVVASQTGIGTSQTDLTGLITPAFTVTTGRVYLVTVILQLVRDTSTPAFATIQLKHSTGSPVYQDGIIETPATTYSLSFERSVYLTSPTDLAAGSLQLKVSAAANTGTVANSASATRRSQIIVRDIGGTA